MRSHNLCTLFACPHHDQFSHAFKGAFQAPTARQVQHITEGMTKPLGRHFPESYSATPIPEANTHVTFDISLTCHAARGQHWTEVPRSHTTTPRQQMFAPLISSGRGYDLERMDCVLTSSDERFGRAQRDASVERGQSREHGSKRAARRKKWGVHGAPRRRPHMTCLEAQGTARMAPGGCPCVVLA